MGVIFQQVQKYEKGVNRIAASRLFDICIALETTIGRMFDGLGGGAGARARPGRNILEDVMATAEGVQLVSLFASIKSIKVRRRVVELVRAMATDD